jgi:glycosyltransferase involved in cell wall biosynthesis
MSALAPVSVVVPCYRCAETIRRAVASAAAQTLPPAEIILVDDASGDGTLELLHRIAAEDASGRTRVVALGSNAGAASARNAGWAVATQPYVAFLDADDAWHPRKVEIQCAFMDAHPDVMLSGHAHAQVEEDAAPDAGTGVRPGFRIVPRSELLLSNRFITPSAMVRRDIAQRFQEGRRYMEDHLLWLEIAAAGGRIARLNAELAFIFKAPFGAAGLSSQTLEMEKGELANYRHLRRTGGLSAAGAAALSALSALKYLRRVLLLRLDAVAGPLASIFPIAYMSITYAITGLLIAFGLAGRSELAADIAVAQGAALATFHAFSANTRHLILGHSATITAGHILLSRLLLVLPLGLAAYALSVYAADIAPGIAAALALRRGVEWLNEVHLCEKEVEHDYVFATGFLGMQGVLFAGALGAALAVPQYATHALFAWALVPLAASVPHLLRHALPPLREFARTLPEMLPHFGSTAILGITIYVFRLLIVLLAAKAVAGELFTAIAIGSFMGSMFANVFGPSLVLHEIRSGRTGFPPLLRWGLVFTTLAGAAIFAAGWTEPAALAALGKSAFFWRATGLALVAGVVMVLAQRVRLRLLRTRAGVEIFGPDVLMNILLVASVPILFTLGGVEASILLYPLNAILALVFYYSADMERSRAPAGRHATADALRTALAFATFLPLFFKLSGEIYNPADPVVDSRGILLELPIPVSVLACYGGIVLLGHYRYAARSLGIIFLLFGLMLLAALVTTSGQLASERGKLLLMLQFILPAFALVYGNLFERREGSREALERGILAVLFAVVPVQLVMTWMQGEVVLQHHMPFFAVYQHFQYVPLMFVSGYIVALYGLWPRGRLRTPLGILGVLLGVYVAGSFSMLAIGLLLAGLALHAWRMLRAGNRSALALLAAVLVAQVGYSLLARDTIEFVEKYGPALAKERPTGTGFISKSTSYEKGVWTIAEDKRRPMDYIVSYKPRQTKPGHVFEVEGELQSGGLYVGLVRGEEFVVSERVTRPGPFTLRLAPEPGFYWAIVSNMLEPGQAVTNARITKMGWTVELAAPRPQAAPAGAKPAAPPAPTAAAAAAAPTPSPASPPPVEAASDDKAAPANDAEAFHARRQETANRWVALLPRNLIERLHDWQLYGSRVGESWVTLLFGHPRPLDRSILSSAHNYYLDFVYNFGVLAILPLLALIVLTLRLVWRHRGAVRSDGGLLGLTLVVLFLVLMDNNFKVALRQPYPGIITFFLWGVLLTRLRMRDEPRAAGAPPAAVPAPA